MSVADDVESIEECTRTRVFIITPGECTEVVLPDEVMALVCARDLPGAIDALDALEVKK